MRDVSEQHAAKAALKGLLLSTSVDLRMSAQNVYAASELLVGRRSVQNDQEAAFLAAAVQSGCNALLFGVTSNVLELHKLERGEYSVSLRPFSISATVRDVLQVCRMSTQDSPSAAVLSWENEAQAAQELPAHVEVSASLPGNGKLRADACIAGRRVEDHANPVQPGEQRAQVQQRRACDGPRGADRRAGACACRPAHARHQRRGPRARLDGRAAGEHLSALLARRARDGWRAWRRRHRPAPEPPVRARDGRRRLRAQRARRGRNVRLPCSVCAPENER